jgi:hypothetical protein
MNDGVKYVTELSWAYRAARVLHIANRLDVFSVLSNGAITAEQLAEKCDTKAETLEKLIIACTAMGLVTKDGDRYANTKMADECLAKGAPLYQGDIIAHSAEVWDYWSEMEDEICGKRSEKQAEAENHEYFIRGMWNIAAGGRGQLFVDSIDLSGCEKLFDVGGGPGCYSILACKKYPGLKAVVFDLPETIKIAREMIEKEGLEDRISVVEGDWDKEEFGQDNGAVLFSNVLHGPGSNAGVKLKKAYESMVPSGLLIVQEFLLDDEKSGPLVSALFNMMVGSYSYSELEDVISSAGFLNCELAGVSEELGSSWVTARKP